VESAGHDAICPLLGLSRHWDGLGSTSAMWQVADGDSVKQADGGILHRRTHTPDPLPTSGRDWANVRFASQFGRTVSGREIRVKGSVHYSARLDRFGRGLNRPSSLSART
jgi:hypothetical protein